MPDCYKCTYRGTVPGDCHSCCKYPGTDTSIVAMFDESNKLIGKKLNIKAQAHGIRMGWFIWPANFDPCWLTNCDGFKAKEEGE